MKETRIIMGMPVTLEVVDKTATTEALDRVFAYFEYVDATFSTYKPDSEIMQINRGELTLARASGDVQQIFALAEQTKRETGGYFDMRHNGMIDPSGIVKGWAIYNAAERLYEAGLRNYYVEAGGDVQVAGKNAQDENWRLGIRNPFNIQQIVKVVSLTDCGIATSGSYVRGSHIYNPIQTDDALDEIVSLTVIGPDVYDADRFATAAFAMGRAGIEFVERLDGFEGYMIDRNGYATLTSAFAAYTRGVVTEPIRAEM